MVTADYSKNNGPVSINLSSSTVMTSSSSFSDVTKQTPMVAGLDGWTAKPLLSVGDTIAGGFRIAGNLDGVAVVRVDADTARLFVNHELGADSGSFYSISNGSGGTLNLQGARIDFFDIDVTTKSVVGGGTAISSIIDRAGNPVTSNSQLQSGALAAFCSSTLVPSEKFGAGRGLVDNIYFAGEETNKGAGGTEWALDIASGKLWAVPDFGRGKWENVSPLDTGDTTHVAFLMGDDQPGAALYLYVGTKLVGGDFLGRNGLRGGQVFVWAADNGDTTAASFASGSRSGSWKALSVHNAGQANTTGYDSLGYKTLEKLAADADALGAFSFARIEDSDLDPNDATKAVFVTTGNADFDNGSNLSGIVYTADFDFTSLSAPTAVVQVVHNTNTAPGMPIRSPDNVEWSADGWIYLQEDRAADIFGAGAPNQNEASILRLNAATGAIERIGQVVRSNYPAGFNDSLASTNGAWETTGIIDVSLAFDRTPGALFLTNVMAHGILSSTFGEGGQMLFLSRPGIDSIADTILGSTGHAKNAIGSAFDDILIGDGRGNRLAGKIGADIISGRAGDDVLIGGAGRDILSGNSGADKYKYFSPVQGGDVITAFSKNDSFVLEGSRFGLGSYHGTLSETNFVAHENNRAADGNDFFVFRTTDDTLWFDANGNKKGGLTLIADIGNDFALQANDILIV